MSQTIVLYGRCSGVSLPDGELSLVVPWKSAFNFTENASRLISAEFASAIVMPVNSTPGLGAETAIRMTVDHSRTNFREFHVRFWRGDAPADQNGSAPLDIDWVAFIPCSGSLT